MSSFGEEKNFPMPQATSQMGIWHWRGYVNTQGAVLNIFVPPGARTLIYATDWMLRKDRTVYVVDCLSDNLCSSVLKMRIPFPTPNIITTHNTIECMLK